MNPSQLALQALKNFGGQIFGATPMGQLGSDISGAYGNATKPFQDIINKYNAGIQSPIPQYNVLNSQNPGLMAYAQQNSDANDQQQRVLAAKVSPTPQPNPIQQGVSTVEKLAGKVAGQIGNIVRPPIAAAPMPSGIPGVNPQVGSQFTDLLNNHILPVTRKYGIPDAVTAAQMAQESGWAQKPAGSNNFFGLKAHSHPGFASFDTPEQGATYYAQTIKALVPNLDQIKNNPMAVLRALQSGKSHYEGDNPDPMQYVYDVSNNPAWTSYGGGESIKVNPKGWKQ